LQDPEVENSNLPLSITFLVKMRVHVYHNSK